MSAPVFWPIVIGIIIALIGVFLSYSLKVIKQYERGVTFRFGHLRPMLEPGLHFLLPGIDKLERVDLRVVTLTIPPQEIITKDNVSVRVNAVVMFEVTDSSKAVLEVENYAVATSQIAQTTLRSLWGGRASMICWPTARSSTRTWRRSSTAKPNGGECSPASWRSRT